MENNCENCKDCFISINEKLEKLAEEIKAIKKNSDAQRDIVISLLLSASETIQDLKMYKKSIFDIER